MIRAWLRRRREKKAAKDLGFELVTPYEVKDILERAREDGRLQALLESIEEDPLNDPSCPGKNKKHEGGNSYCPTCQP